MGFLSYNAPMPDHLGGMKSTILYARPFRTQIAILIGLINVMNFGILIMCCVAVGTISYVYQLKDAHFHTRLFFFFVPIPLGIWINSCVELYKRYRRTLQPLRIVITSCITFIFWGICGGLWSPCIYPPWYVQYGRMGAVDYCPFVSGEGWDWIGADVSPPQAYYVIPWLLLPAAVLYLLYLGFGGVALHHVRKENRLNAPVNYQHEMYPDERYKYSPTVYSEPFHVSDSLPSTYRPEFSSPVKVSQPPSYDKSTASASHSYVPSRSASSYHSEEKDSRGPCTCNCPHH